MGLFDRTPKVPNTISDRQMANIQARAKLRHDRNRFTAKQIQQRLATEQQRKLARWS